MTPPNNPEPPPERPCTDAGAFHRWQQGHRYFGRHGLASLKKKEETNEPKTKAK